MGLKPFSPCPWEAPCCWSCNIFDTLKSPCILVYHLYNVFKVQLGFVGRIGNSQLRVCVYTYF